MATYIGGAEEQRPDTGYFGNFVGSSGSPLIFLLSFSSDSIYHSDWR